MKTVTSLLQDEEVGEPADTGSATHKAIENWHKGNKKDEKLALDKMLEDISKYPKADLSKAASMFRAYIKDPRNIEAEIIAIEEKIEIELPPLDIDPTKQPIIVLGTLDQIRLVNGKLQLWDVKTGKRPPSFMKTMYSLQLACYCQGASEKLKKEVHPGGFIRTFEYVKNIHKNPDPATCPENVYVDVDWKYEDIGSLLQIIKQKVALVRMGLYSITPTEACSYCSIGLNNCPSLLQQLTIKGKPSNGKENPKQSKPGKRKTKPVTTRNKPSTNPFNAIGSLTGLCGIPS